LREIAGVSHTDSRFYHDSGFPRQRCDELYRTWIEKSCNGYADIVLVAEVEDTAVGYISCHLLDGGGGQIGLVGVDAQMQGHGLGRALICSALTWFAGQGATRVTVVTQGRNLAAQRLYARSGFVPKSVQLWYHRWFS
jgi:ribosomal protein S18 acetylase RimI-like enzyme